MQAASSRRATDVQCSRERYPVALRSSGCRHMPSKNGAGMHWVRTFTCIAASIGRACSWVKSIHPPPAEGEGRGGGGSGRAAGAEWLGQGSYPPPLPSPPGGEGV